MTLHKFDRVMSVFLVTASVCMFSGCSLLSPVPNVPPKKFLVDTVPGKLPVKRSRAATLMVATPETSSIYNTNQMAYTQKPYQIEYYSQNEWAETPIQMLQPLLVQTMENMHFFRAVITTPSLNHYDYMLNTQLLVFKEDLTWRVPRFEMVMRAQISRSSVNQVVATKDFSVSEPVPSGTPYGGVMAANRATEKILAEIARFCVERIP
jgi:cholesterol transport system auxiliary component